MLKCTAGHTWLEIFVCLFVCLYLLTHFNFLSSNYSCSFFKNKIQAGQWWHRPLIPLPGTQRQVDPCEFEASLSSRVSSRTARVTQKKKKNKKKPVLDRSKVLYGLKENQRKPKSQEWVVTKRPPKQTKMNSGRARVSSQNSHSGGKEPAPKGGLLTSTPVLWHAHAHTCAHTHTHTHTHTGTHAHVHTKE